MTVDVRAADRSDVATLASIGSAAFRAAYEPYNPPDDLAAHLERNYTTEAITAEMQAGKLYQLAITEGRAAGLCKLQIADSPAKLGTGRSLQIEQLYVAPDAQRLGIGRILVDRAVEIAADEDCSHVWLSVWEEADWAVAFYQKYGFRQFDVCEFMLGSNRQQDLLMQVSVREKAA